MKWSDESVTKYKFSNHSKEEVIEILKEDKVGYIPEIVKESV